NSAPSNFALAVSLTETSWRNGVSLTGRATTIGATKTSTSHIRVIAKSVFHAVTQLNMLRVADPRSGARLCEAQQPRKGRISKLSFDKRLKTIPGRDIR